MRIIVDIEGDNVNVTTEPAHKTSVNVGSGVPVAAARRTAPPELLKAAAALGAHDAGPAPEHIAGSVKSALMVKSPAPETYVSCCAQK